MYNGRLARLCVLGTALLLAATAMGDPVRLRFATVAPQGTGWAREIDAFTRDVATATDGGVQLKWYMGGIAGDEFEVIDRIHKDQLDGAALSIACEKLAPSLHV